MRSIRCGISLQWSPVLETGNTLMGAALCTMAYELQWSPVLETGNTMLLGS